MLTSGSLPKRERTCHKAAFEPSSRRMIAQCRVLAIVDARKTQISLSHNGNCGMIGLITAFLRLPYGLEHLE